MSKRKAPLSKSTSSQLTVSDLIAKRKELWMRSKDRERDKIVVNAIANKILDTPSLREEILQKPYLIIECCFSIVDKQKKNVPFFFNNVQRDFINKIEAFGTSRPYFILKGRQQGFTTLITAIQLSYAITRRNFSGFTLADRDDNTKAIFIDKAKTMYNSLPSRLKPTEKFNSVNELFFEKLNSSWRVAPASPNVGRSRTLSFIHFSEVAFFKCSLSELQKSIGEAATSDALCIYETTANGFNESKELWDSGSCHNLFYEWYKSEDYISNEYEYLKSNDPWLKNRLLSLEKIGLSLEQRTWYAKKYSSYIDKSSIKQEYPCSSEEAFISSGNCIFDKEAISNYLSTFDVNRSLGYFEYDKIATHVYGNDGKLLNITYSIENIQFKEADDGYISIVTLPHTLKKGSVTEKKPYVIGADTAGLGKDYFTAKVIDNITGRVVATLRRQYMDEDLFAEQLYCLGKYYNDALIAVETNFSRQPVRHLRALSYENLYRTRKLSTFKDENDDSFGFITSSVTRPIIISNLVSVMREDPYLETDRETLKEMISFVRHSDGHQSAASGAHDDLVLACAIARYVSIDYDHNMSYIDTGSDILTKSFSPIIPRDETFMEW